MHQFKMRLREVFNFLGAPDRVLPPAVPICDGVFGDPVVGKSIGDRSPVEIELRGHCRIVPDDPEEVTVEIRPGTVPVSAAHDLREASVNRVPAVDEAGEH